MIETILQNSAHFSGVFDIGTVQSLEYDDLGQGIKEPTGNLYVRLASTGAVVKCPYLTQSGGNSQFFGGLPETNVICILANLGEKGSNIYIVLGFIPAPMNMMIAKRREMKHIEQGEIQIQASANDGNDNWRGAYAKFDIYGRLIINSGDDSFKITVGDMLSNEYTDDVLVVKDAISAKNVIYRMQFSESYSDTIDRDGNKIERWNSILQDCTGNHASTIQGSYLLTTGKDIRLASAGTGQYISITTEGVTIQSLSHILNANGDVKLSAGQQMVLAAMCDLALVSADNVVLKAATQILMTATSLTGRFKNDMDLDSSIGNAYLTALGIVQLSSRAAAQPVIRGANWLAWINTPAYHLDSLGMPITQVTTPDLLSDKVFIP